MLYPPALLQYYMLSIQGKSQENIFERIKKPDIAALIINEILLNDNTYIDIKKFE